MNTTPADVGASIEWPDPRQVSAYIGIHRGRRAWAVVSDDKVLGTAALTDDADPVDAQMGVLTTLLTHPDLVGMPIDLATNDRKLRSTLEENRTLASNIEPLPACRTSVCDPGLEYAKHVADETADAAGPVAVIAATDGARERHAAVGGYGWVTESGQYGYGFIKPTSPVEAELVAISSLLDNTDPAQPLVVFVDSLHARRLAKEALAGISATPQVRAVANVLTKIAKHAGRDVTLRDVAGHSGDPLNEGAHRLAVLPRRGARMGFADELVAELAARIAEETKMLVGQALAS